MTSRLQQQETAGVNIKCVYIYVYYGHNMYHVHILGSKTIHVYVHSKQGELPK